MADKIHFSVTSPSPSANIFLKFLINHVNTPGYINDLDNFIDIDGMMRTFVISDKNVLDKLYQRIIETEKLPNDVELVNLFGPIKAYKICRRLEPSSEKIYSVLKNILISNNIKYLISYKYYVKILLNLVEMWYDSMDHFIEIIYRLVPNALIQYYIGQSMTSVDRLQSISRGGISNSKFVKILLDGCCENLPTAIYYSFNIRILKLLSRKYPKTIQYIRVPNGANAKNVVWMKHIGINWSVERIYTNRSGKLYSSAIPEFGIAVRKQCNKSILHQCIEKIMRHITTKNLTKLALYYV